MENIIYFIKENYFIIAIFLVLILMIVIGYYAEKTGFGKKLVMKEKKDGVERPNNLNAGINDLTKQQTSFQLESEPVLDNKNEVEQKVKTIQSKQNGNINTFNSKPIETKEFPKEEFTYYKEGNKETNHVNVELQNLKQKISLISESSNQMYNELMSESNPQDLIEETNDLQTNKLSNDIIIANMSDDIDSMKLDNSFGKFNKNVKIDTNIKIPQIKDLSEEKDIWDF